MKINSHFIRFFLLWICQQWIDGNPDPSLRNSKDLISPLSNAKASTYSCNGHSNIACLYSTFHHGRNLNRKSKERSSFKPSQPVFYTKTLKSVFHPGSYPVLYPAPHQRHSESRIKTSRALEAENQRSIETSSPETYENCPPPFQTWLCQLSYEYNVDLQATVRKIKKMLIVTSSPRPMAIVIHTKDGRKTNSRKNFSGENTFNYQNLKVNYDDCTNTINSWKCQEQKKTFTHRKYRPVLAKMVGFSTVTYGNSLHPTSTPAGELQKITTPRTYIQENRCSHPFHGWLCQSGISHTTASQLIQNISPATLTSSVTLNPVTSQYFSSTPTSNSLYKQRPGGRSACIFSSGSWICRNSDPSNPRDIKNFNIIQNTDPVKVSLTRPLEKNTTTIAYTPFLQEKKICSHPLHAWKCGRSNTVESTVAPQQSHDSVAISSFSNQHLKSTSFDRQAIKHSNYDKCSHPFHSWLCRKPKIENSISSPPAEITQIIHPPRTTPIPIIHPPRTTATLRPTTELITTLSSSPSNNVNKNKKNYDKCTHAFHSWLCNAVHKKAFSTTKPSTIPYTAPVTERTHIPEKYPPNAATPQKVNIVEKTTKSQYDKCSHAFHSWLCKRLKQPSSIDPNNHHNLNVPVKENKQPKLNDCSNSVSGDCKDTTTANNSPITVFPPKQTTHNSNTKETLKPFRIKDYGKCNHAFHKWLCKTESTTIAPKNKNFVTTSFEKEQRVHNESSKPPPIVKPKEQNSFKCNHPFHSWMCHLTIKQDQISSHPPKIDDTSGISTDYQNIPLKVTNPCNEQFEGDCDGITVSSSFEANEKQESSDRKEEREKIPTTAVVITSEMTPSDHFPNLNKAYSTNSPCSHSFHSWLCRNNVNKKKNITPKPSEQVVIRSSSTPQPTPKSRPTLRVTTTTIPTTSSTPPLLTTSTIVTTSKKSAKGTNPCSHAFHAWLCQPLRPRLVMPFNPPRLRPTTDEASSFTTPTPTTISNEIISQSFTQVSQLPSPPPTKEIAFPINGSTDRSVENRCDHPFPSLRCPPFSNTQANFPFLEIPDIRSLPLEDEEYKAPIPVFSPLTSRRVRRVRVNRRRIPPQFLPFPNVTPNNHKDKVFKNFTERTKDELIENLQKDLVGKSRNNSSDHLQRYSFNIDESMNFESKRFVPKEKNV